MPCAAALALACLASLLPAAHALRWHGPWAGLAWLAPLACLLATRRPFARLAVQAALARGSLDLAHAGAQLVGARLAMGHSVARLAAIMAVAACLPLGAALALHLTRFSGKPTMRSDHGFQESDRRLPASAAGEKDPSAPLARPARPPAPARETGVAQGGLTGFLALVLVMAALSAALLKGPAGLVLADRFAAGAGWLQAVVLALYAGFVAEELADPVRSSRVRRAVWTGFSVVFFLQLCLGLAGFTRFLLNASPHPPVPALITAGPLYRGEGFFMPALFTVSVLLVGPAWCSHLCYVGAWDSACAGKHPPRPAPAWMSRVRAGLALAVLATAWGLGQAGVGPAWAATLAVGFGLAGVGVMLRVSRRSGYMAHCAGFCPMGLLAGILGRLSPWRLRVGPDCTACGACARACRYDALRPEHLAAGRPGLSCSLCLDCLPRCPRASLTLTAFGRDLALARPAFAVLAGSLHAVFLGLARM